MKRILTIIAIMVACMLTGIVYVINSPRRATAIVVFFILIATAMTVAALFYSRNNSLPYNKASIVIAGVFLISFIIRAFYIAYTPTWVRQHDVIGFSQGFGQAAFIEYFCERIRLIDFDPRKLWGFFQPPLHHMLAGLWLRFMSFIGLSYGHACENVQCLTLFYAMLIDVMALKVLKLFEVEDGPLVAGFSLIALSPCFVMLSGSINNDILCTLLQLVSMYYFILWMRNERMKDIALSGLFLGLSMMTKLSGILLAPAMAIVFLLRLIKAVKGKKGAGGFSKYICQYLVFGIISVPIGVWSPVRNLIKFGVPLNFTPEVGEPIEGVSLFERFIDVRTVNPFTNMISNNNPFDEYNIILAMLKTSLTGEADYSGVFAGSVVGWCLLITGALVAVMTLVSAVYIMRKSIKQNEGELLEEKAFMLVWLIVSVAFLINLCVKIPNFSSQDYRYIAHVSVIGAVFVALYLKENKVDITKITSRINRTIYAIVAFFSLSSLLMYLLAGTVTW